MAPTQRVPPKKDVALALLEQASMYVHLDPRSDAVQVPAWFKKQPQLVLQVGLNMAVPIPDLNVDERGLSCTLSFNRAPFFCMIPWPAVFALVGENGRAMVWAEDVPAEVAAQAQAQKAPEKPRTHLRSVGEHESAPPPAVEKPAVVSEATTPKVVKRSEAKASKAAKPSAAKPAKEAAKPAATGAAKAGKPAAVKATSKAAAKPAVKLEPKPSAEAKSRAKKPAAVAERPAPVAAPEPAPVAQPAKKAVQPKPEAARAETETSKPKRELPPYLRVVK